MNQLIDILPWSEFKAFVDDGGLPLQYVEFSDRYVMRAERGPFMFGCQINKSDPASADQAEFEADYRSDGNRPDPLLSSDVFNGQGICDEFELADGIVMEAKVGADPLPGRKGIWLQASGEILWGLRDDHQGFLISQEMPTFLPHGPASHIWIKAHGADVVVQIGEVL